MDHPDLIVGKETSDDAGVFRVRNDLALIQTVDFFTPMVNNPKDFGRIAAANALSDVYAMGGAPLTAMNIVCFPREKMPVEILKDILHGGFEVIHNAGAILVGGHSVDDAEIKYGLSVTGVVHPDRVVTNAGAAPGDRLILTKPLGTGILATAIKGKMIAKEAEREAIRWMTLLNRDAAEAMQEVGPSACTDITGFGLLGHALEMALTAQVTMELWSSQIPVIPTVMDNVQLGMMPAGSFENRQYCESMVSVDKGVDPLLVDIMADAQTSGGLLIAVPEDRAGLLIEKLQERGVFHAEIGRVVAPSAHRPKGGIYVGM
jgi:selenide,water dikinase